MPLPATLDFHVERLRTIVRELNASGATRVPLELEQNLGQLQRWVCPTNGLDSDYAATRQACEQLAQLFRERGLLARADDRALIQARELALIAIDRLDERLEIEARPSEDARLLGLGW